VIIGLYDELRDTGYPLSPKAQAMLMYLIVRANKERRRSDGGEWEFPQWIEVKSSDLMEAMATSTRPAIYSIRDELEQGGWILHVPGIGNHVSSYMVLPTRPAERERISKDPKEKDRLKRFMIWKKNVENRA
jgi:hypothetical protein